MFKSDDAKHSHKTETRKRKHDIMNSWSPALNQKLTYFDYIGRFGVEHEVAYVSKLILLIMLI